MAEEESLSLEDGGLVSEKGTRRIRKEEPKLSDVNICCWEFSTSFFSFSSLLTIGN